MILVEYSRCISGKVMHLSASFNLFLPLLLRPGTGAVYCDQLVCLSVCLSAASISLEPLDRSSRFLCRSAVAVAQSSSGGVAIR